MMELQGHEQVMARLKKIETPPDSASNSMAKIGVQGLEDNYEGNKLGWRELKPETIRRKGNSRILDKSGTMKRSYSPRNTETFGVEFVNTDKPEKVAFHQKTRPHLKLLEETQQEMLRAYMAEMLR